MEKQLAHDICVKIGKSKTENYKQKVLRKEEYNDKFSNWVDGKDVLGIINVSKNNDSYYFVFIDWWCDGNYYLILYNEDKSKTLLELHKVKEEYDCLNIEWRYRPTKRDDLNNERKECFAKYYGDVVKRIEVPKSMDNIEYFLDDIFDLIEKRVNSDNIIFKENEKQTFPEGRVYERIHKNRERNSALIRLVKNERLLSNNNLKCEVCGFDFKEVYGELGDGFIEAHHTVPVCELDENNETRKEDIILVCSNCHSMLHRKRPWLGVEEIKDIIKRSR